MTPREPLGLYLHIPFCERKCSYCHFAIDPGRTDASRQERYLSALLTEVAAVGAAAGRAPADTIYLGGGTPSQLSLERLGRLLEALRAAFAVAPDAELTLEANPRDLDRAGYQELRGLGVNRLSLGVQSFDDAVLRSMDRSHTASEARRAVADARAAGFDDVSIDLILGWPGETQPRWRQALRQVAELMPSHVSLYVLEVEGKTLLSHRARNGGLSLPDDDLVADLYALTVEALDALGVHRYEISNFARAGREARHNGKYWDDQPFLGFGMSAHSYSAGRRSWNVASFGQYCRRIEAGGTPREGERVLGVEAHRAEALFTGLRRAAGVERERFRARHGVDPLLAYADALRDPLAAGLLLAQDGWLRLSERGVLVSNEVFRALV